MRVIAGSARGIPLLPPPTETRPTMDRVRAAIFSSLGDAIPRARTLDLFAGSGAMGIEALSRGAASATFVDSIPQAASCIKRNLRQTHLHASVQTMDAFRFLDLYGSTGFDLIFADPPYAKHPSDRHFANELLTHPSLPTSLSPGGTLVLERFAYGPKPLPSALTLLRSRRYGESEIAYYYLPSE